MVSKEKKSRYEIPEFIDFIERLSKEQPYIFCLYERNSDKESYLEEFKTLYSNHGKHYYSDISIYCYNETYDELDYTIKNLRILYDYLLNSDINTDTLQDNLKRFIDHVMLETYRNSEINDKVGSITTKILQKNLDLITNSIEKNLNKVVDKKVEQIDTKIDNIGVESVAVIGIFSAVIMTFFGGLSFFGSALENMNDTDPKLTLKVITLIGIVMFNVFYILFLFIGKVINRPLITRCEHFSENKCEECKTCNNAKSLWYDHRIFIIVNLILIVIFFMISIRIPELKVSW